MTLPGKEQPQGEYLTLSGKEQHQGEQLTHPGKEQPHGEHLTLPGKEQPQGKEYTINLNCDLTTCLNSQYGQNSKEDFLITLEENLLTF